MKQKTPQLEDLLSMLGQTQDMMEELRQQNSSEQSTGTITTANEIALRNKLIQPITSTGIAFDIKILSPR